MKTYIKKPVAVQAIQWTCKNADEVQSFIECSGCVKGIYVYIGTLEGLMVALEGDYIIKGVNGEFYPCKPDIFKKTYYTQEEYITWSPKSVFENSCKSNGEFSFGDAVLLMKQGKKVARKGWNGKGMWLKLIPAGNASFQGFDMQDCIGMKTAANEMQPGWLASQADMLAEDWELVA